MITAMGTTYEHISTQTFSGFNVAKGKEVKYVAYIHRAPFGVGAHFPYLITFEYNGEIREGRNYCKRWRDVLDRMKAFSEFASLMCVTS